MSCTSLLSLSTCTRNVGSSLMNRFKAFEKESRLFLSCGLTARLITGSGTWMDSMVYSGAPSEVNVSPDEHSIPKNAQISPARPSVMSYNVHMHKDQASLQRCKLNCTHQLCPQPHPPGHHPPASYRHASV